MRYELVLAPSAVRQLRDLDAHARSRVRNALEVHLRNQPELVSKSRIKRLRGLARPQYRLRVGEIRVFYDVTEGSVEILAIVTKRQAEAWLSSEGIRAEAGGPGSGEG